jgi:tRNA(adenine34) deaminase
MEYAFRKRTESLDIAKARILDKRQTAPYGLCAPHQACLGVSSLEIPPPDEIWMRLALGQAEEAGNCGEIPVGAVMVFEGKVIAQAGNNKERNQDPLGHAELLAIRSAAQVLGRWRLTGCTLYVTLEPCAMCAGAIVHSRIDRVVYGTPDPKAGAVQSLYEILSDPRLNHSPEVASGPLKDEASSLLKAFFRSRRK